MNKFLKLTGVSMLAIMTANAANAAGYTCEELIEYTSCNTGYYLNNGDCIGLVTSCDAGYYLTGAQYECPEGYTSGTNICLYFGGEIREDLTQEECEFDGIYYGEGCWKDGVDWGYDVKSVVSGTTNTCPSGYAYATGICIDMSNFDTGVSEEDCSYAEWYASGCWKEIQPENGKFVAGTLVGGKSCVAASAGSYSPGGLVASATTCAAGTYQPQSAQSSCITTPKGNYSIAGAAAYTACPATGLTDKDGNTVVATTTTEGATTLAACIVDESVYFADTKGTYHYKSNCTIDMFAAESYSVTNEAECEAVDGSWYYGYCIVNGSSLLPKTEAECNKLASKVGKEGDAELTWSDGRCTCDATGDGYDMVWSGTRLFCTHF